MWHISVILPANFRLHPDEEQPEDDGGQTNALFRVHPDILNPHEARCNEEDPVEWNEEETC